ncbi:MAG: DegV family protein [Oscillospiraceae bacterium]|jgi:DegV family protein with EDD domain|nr:DegV family protein [Oscillospiraceae bacterium]
MKVKITADSTCDLPHGTIDRYGIGIAPILIIKDDKPYMDRIDITAADIFEYVESGAGMTQTCALNVSDYLEHFTRWRKDCDAIIHVSISSHFSSCYQSARIAAEELGNVYVVDSMNLSTGSGHIVLDAAIMAEEGMTPEQIVKELEALVPRVEASFVIGKLKYLHLGGRCSGLAALGANLLKLNPCIEVINGKMEVGKKYRGSFDKVLNYYVEDKLSGRDDIDNKRIFITYPPGFSADIVNSVANKIKSMHYFIDIIICEAGCVISNHCGPICLGVLFYRK